MRSIEQHQSWPAAIALSVLYAVIYVLLDAVSNIHDLQHTEITSWSPNIAFMIAVAMYYGARAAPLLIATPGLSEIVLRQAAPSGIPVIGAMVCTGCIYTVAGIILRRLQFSYSEPTIRWFAIFLLVIATAALLDAISYSAVLTWSGNLSPGSYLDGVRIGWVGDMNGIIILLPLALILRSAERSSLRDMRSNPWLLLLQAAALALVFWIVFRGDLGMAEESKQTGFYLLFLPIIWIALSWGAAATVIALALLQAAVVLLVAPHYTADSFLAIQVLMILLAGTGSFMGISVSENARFALLMRSKDDELSQLNTQMAVSEMNSAIGHELNNPLAALVNYLRSANLILQLPDLDRVLLRSALDKALGEAIRSVDVVRKLRAFFRYRTVHRQPVDPKKIVAECLAGMQTKLRSAGIASELQMQPGLPPVLADPLQLSIVLQNLLGNAYDALSGAQSRRRSVAVVLTYDADEVQFRIEDSGPGLPDAWRDQIFRPIRSNKPGGMGLGLAICRSLVEANEGRIWLGRSDADGTSIIFSVPIGVRAVGGERA
jgi:two-component system sensor kinase FixL